MTQVPSLDASRYFPCWGPFWALLSALILTGCGGSDGVSIQASDDGNSGGNGENSQNPCASYVTNGQTRQGAHDPATGHCTYDAAFASAATKITTDLDIPALIGDGAHIFRGTLIIGESYDSDTALAAAGIAEGGDGPTLTIAAGATLAWVQGRALIINRGAQLVANGTASTPITLTSETDVLGSANAEAVDQWGGVIINGFGVTNECSYTGTRGMSDFALASECHVVTEGIAGDAESRHGGINDADNSGRLQYVVVKHTGGDLGAGNDLNGVTFASVGSGTVVNHLQTYSTLDDGVEFFGGAVNVSHFAGIYNRDDTLDIDAGYVGTIDTALVIQSQGEGNHCIEADGVDDHSSRTTELAALVAAGLVSAPVIRNLTCIVSPSAMSSQDPGAGWRLREGVLPVIEDSMVIASFIAPAAGDANYCLRAENGTLAAIRNGSLTFRGVLMACATRVRGVTEEEATTAGILFADVAANAAMDPTIATQTDLVLLEGAPPIFSVAVDMMMLGGAGLPAPQSSRPSIGALTLSDVNEFAGWTYGIFADSRGQALYFE